MGVTIGPTYITEEGFEISPLYISLSSTRILPIGNGNYQLTFIFEAFKSRDDKKAGKSQIKLPYGMNVIDVIQQSSVFSQTTLFNIAYKSLEQRFGSYNIEQILEAGQLDNREYKYNTQGYDIDGFNAQGFNALGYDINGFNIDGFNASGFNTQGYDLEGYNVGGYNTAGYNRQGFNMTGYNSAGYDMSGYDIYGFNAQGYSMNGGYNYSGHMPDGTLAVLPSTIIAYNNVFPGDQQSFNIRVDPANLENLINDLTSKITAAVAQAAAAAEAQAAAEAEAVAASEAQAAAEAVAAAEVQPEAQPEVQPEAQPEVQSEAQPEVQPEPPQPEAQPEPPQAEVPQPEVPQAEPQQTT